MRFGYRVAWTQRSAVYHRRTGTRSQEVYYRVRGGTEQIWDDVTVAVCGATLYGRDYDAKTGPEREALKLGRRPCLRCWPDGTPEATRGPV